MSPDIDDVPHSAEPLCSRRAPLAPARLYWDHCAHSGQFYQRTAFRVLLQPAAETFLLVACQYPARSIITVVDSMLIWMPADPGLQFCNRRGPPQSAVQGSRVALVPPGQLRLHRSLGVCANRPCVHALGRAVSLEDRREVLPA